MQLTLLTNCTSNLNIGDIARCKRIIERQLSENSIVVDSKEIDKLTIEIMDLAYAKGGSYSDKTIEQFAKVYIARFRL